MKEKGVSITEKSIFGDYSKAEDRVTAALLKILHYGGHDLVQYIFEECDLPSNSINVRSQIYVGSSRPDGAISCNCSYQIYIESKIVPNSVNAQQLANHKKLIDSNNKLLYITSDESIPTILENLYNVFWINWEDLIEKLQSYGFSDRLLEYLIKEFVLLVKHLIYEKLNDKPKRKSSPLHIDDTLLESTESVNERVIIVGGRWGEDVALNYGFYACQANRFFLPARYMAFYYNHRVKYLFEIQGTPIEAVDIQKGSAVPASYFTQKEPTYKPEMRKLFQLKLIQEFQPEIQNDSRDKNGNLCAFVQRQKYTTVDKIKSAKYTSQL